MATNNSNATINNINPVLLSLSTKLMYHTDREAGAFARGALIDSVNNLGVGVTNNDPFTLLV